MKFSESVDYIYNLERHNKDFSLDNVKKVLKSIGNPEKKLRAVHVAGTNGKGSVCEMIERGLMEAGFKVGMYTSPHLQEFNERIRINEELIAEEELGRLTDRLKQIQEDTGVELTFFEAATVIAFIYFEEKKVDYAVVEVGMGGRLDATNVLKPLVSVITNISLDHQNILGETVEKIAHEKAGIIKKETPVVTNASGEVLEVIREYCFEKNCHLIIPETIEDVELGMQGSYQIENAATAIAVLKELGVKGTAIYEGLLKAKWPGRFEFVKDNILLDCAHNPKGMKTMLESVKELEYEKIYLILGIMQKADHKGIIAEVKKSDAKIIITKPNMKNALPIEELKGEFENATTSKSLKEAISIAKKKASDKDLILITGSIFLIGEAREYFL